MAGGTRLVLENYGLPPQIRPEDARSGFGACLDKLTAVVPPRSRAPARPGTQTLRIERVYNATPEALYDARVDPAQFAR